MSNEHGAPADVRKSGHRAVSLGWLSVYAAALLTVITITAGLTSLLFDFVPRLKPEAPPVRISGSIVSIRLEPNVTVGAYFRRKGAPPRSTDSPLLLGTPGVVAYVSYRIDGARTDKGAVDAIWYSGSGWSRLPPRYQSISSNKEKLLDHSAVPLGAEQTGGVVVQWIAVPVQFGLHRYRIREELTYEGRLVDLAQSGIVTCNSHKRHPCLLS